MRISLIFLWGLVGWCATLVPILLHLPPGLDGTPDPPPRPNWATLRLIGVIGGIIGGLVFTQVFGHSVPWLTAGPQTEPWMTAGPHPEPWIGVVVAAATTVGAFLGASLLVDLYRLVRGGRATRG
jgi:hypothetical protein